MTLPTAGVYRPGLPMPVTIEAAGPGLIEVRGDGVQGIDWPAAGRGSVTVPLMIWRSAPDDLPLTINGQRLIISIVPLRSGEAAPPALAETPIDVAAAALSARLADDDSIAQWSPGRPEVQRRWLVLAAAAAALAVCTALPWRGRRGALAAIGISAIACATIAGLAPTPPVRREISAAGRPQFIEINYAATCPAIVREPFKPGLMFLPRSLTEIDTSKPVLECDAAGKPTAIRITLAAHRQARFVRPAGAF